MVPDPEPVLGVVLILLGGLPRVGHEVHDVAAGAGQLPRELHELIAAHLFGHLRGGVAQLVDRNRHAPAVEQIERLAPLGQAAEGPVDRLLVGMEAPQVDVRAHLGPVGEHALDELHLVARNRGVHEVERAGHHHHLVGHGLHRGARGEVEVGEALGRVRLRIPVVGHVRRVPDLPHVYGCGRQLRVCGPELFADVRQL